MVYSPLRAVKKEKEGTDMPVTKSGSRPQDIRRRNSSALLNLLSDREDMTVGELAEEMELSRTAVQNILGGLVESGMVEASCKRDSAVGTKSLSYAISPTYKYCICIHVSSSFVVAEVFDFCLRRKNFHVIELKLERYSEVLRTVVRAVREVMEDSAVGPEQLFGLVVSLSGMVDSAAGVVREFTGSDSSVDFGRDLPLLADLQAELGFVPPVLYMDNLCYFSAYSMLHQSRYASAKSYLYLLAHDRGVGTAFISDRKIIKGYNGLMGEIGHTTVDFASSIRCRCGRRGCFEAMLYPETVTAAVHSALAEAKTDWNWGETVAITDLFEAAEAGDGFGQCETRKVARLFANLLRNAQIMYDPELIIFHDSYSFVSEYFHRCVREELDAICSGGFPAPELSFETAGFNTSVRAGAALYCREMYLR